MYYLLRTTDLCAQEANNRDANISSRFSFVDWSTGARQPVCTDILLNGAFGWLHEGATQRHTEAAFPLLARDPLNDPKGELVLGPIPLDNRKPSSGVVIEVSSGHPLAMYV